jgi:hypothetical protein
MFLPDIVYVSNSSYCLLNKDFFILIILIHSFSQKRQPRLIYVRTFSAYHADFIYVNIATTPVSKSSKCSLPFKFSDYSSI